MNFTKPLLTLFSLLFILSIPSARAQQDLNNPGDYISAFSAARGDMDTKYMQYLSTAAHSRRAKKIEKVRQEVIENINECRIRTTQLPKYKGDNSLRQASINYIQLCYNVFNEDYQKIINMEDLVEQSFDEMQAYLLLQEKVGQRLKEGSDSLSRIVHDFAAKYNVTLTEQKSELSDKMDAASKLNAYRNKLYLIFFKCNWEDGQMVTAMNNKKVNDVEQARSALDRYAIEGMGALDSLRTFDGDPSLANACRQVLQYYKNAAENDMPKLTDYYLKQEEFEKAKKNFEAKSSRDRNQADVDAYNKSVKDINAAVGTFNQINNKLNNGRNQVLNDWNNADRRFGDEHMPHYKK